MGLFDWLGGKIDGHEPPRASVNIPQVRNLTSAATGVAAIAEQHYVRLWIAYMFLKNDSKWFSSRFPLAYSLIGLDYGGQQTEITNVSGKNKFDIKQPDIGKSILQNYALTPLLPFHGGTVAVDCGLVSMEADNGLKAFASTVSDIAGKVSAPQVAGIVDLASSIADGVQSLLGAGKAETMLYIHNTFAAGTLASGFIFLSDKKQSDIDAAKVWMTSNGARYGASQAALQALDPQNYVVLRIEVTLERDDWRSLAAIATPLEAALDAKYSGDDAKAKLLLGQAKLAAAKSKDLTRLDATRVIKGIDAEFHGPTGAPIVEGQPVKHDIAAFLANAAARTSIEDALAAPITEETVIEQITKRGGGW